MLVKSTLRSKSRRAPNLSLPEIHNAGLKCWFIDTQVKYYYLYAFILASWLRLLPEHCGNKKAALPKERGLDCSDLYVDDLRV